jgi:hypothetical protein
MVALQLITDEGAYICNVRERDLPKIGAGTRGTFVIIHCAIRLDAMNHGLYELYETKKIEASSIDFYRSLQRETDIAVQKERPVACAEKGRENG